MPPFRIGNCQSFIRCFRMDSSAILKEGKNERFGKIREKGKMAAAGKVYMQRLLAGAEFLLDLPVRFHDLFGLHGRKYLGNDL